MSANPSARRRPASAEEILDSRVAFSKLLAEAKKEPLPLGLTWYPYDSMASIDHMATFFPQAFRGFRARFRVGAGD